MGIRKILEATYQARMTVYTRVFREKDGRTVQTEVAAIRSQPCAISWGGGFQKRGTALREGQFAEIHDEARIFAPPELCIPAGSRIVVTSCGVTKSFISSGEGIFYPTHQEILVTREAKA